MCLAKREYEEITTKMETNSKGLAKRGKTCNTMVGYLALWLKCSTIKNSSIIS